MNQGKRLEIRSQSSEEEDQDEQMPQLKAELENFFNEQNDVKPPLSGKTLSKMSLS